MTVQEQLATRVRDKRKRLRMTQAELAAKIGTSQNAIARLEGGHGNPSANLMQRVATALNFEIVLYVRPGKTKDSSPKWLQED